MISTQNFKLSKPESTDLFGDVLPGMMSDNMDIIDRKLGKASLSGTLEINVSTDTTCAYEMIPGGKYHVTGANLTLRPAWTSEDSIEEIFENMLDIQVYGVYFQGSYYAVIKCSENIPQGTYYIDWKATEVS